MNRDGDLDPQQVHVHRPAKEPGEGPPTEGSSWVFNGVDDDGEKSLIPLSPRALTALLLAGLALVTAYFMVPVLFGGGGDGGSRASGYVAPTTPTQTPTAVAEPGVAVSSATPVASPTVAVPAPVGDLLQAWYDDTARRLVIELEAVVGGISEGASSRDPDALQDGCVDLDGFAAEARGARPPLSEREIAENWDDAADLADAAADDCLDAIAADDAALLRTARSEAAASLDRARKAIAATQATL